MQHLSRDDHAREHVPLSPPYALRTALTLSLVRPERAEVPLDVASAYAQTNVRLAAQPTKHP